MASRTVAQGDYRFGFNGKENDNETYGTGNALDFGARIYDPRIGRWFSTDPQSSKYRELSPYSAFGDSPLVIIDPGGETLKVVANGPHLIEKYKTLVKIAFNYKVTADVDDNGVVTFNLVEGAELNDLENSGFYSLLSATGSDHTVSMTLIDHNDPLSSSVKIDSYMLQTLDLDDCLKLGTEDYTYNSRGALIHTTSEYLEKSEMQDKGRDMSSYGIFTWCHSFGLRDENATSGFIREDGSAGGNDWRGTCPTRLTPVSDSGLGKERVVKLPTEDPNSRSTYDVKIQWENGYNVKDVKYEKVD